jgi:DNA modification methylase
VIADSLADLAVPIGDLRTLEGNPRRGDVAAVARSLKRFGQRKPIVARHADGVVVAGNHTLAAALELGWTEIAVSWVDDDDATAKAYALADNRTSALGSFDEGALAAMVAEVHAVDPDLLLAASFDEVDLQALGVGVGAGPGLTDPDEVPEPPAEPVSRPGDLWVLGPHRLLCGDATDPEAVERVMAGERAQLMATDPPYLVDYGGGRHPKSESNQGASTKDKRWEHYQEQHLSSELFQKFVAVAFAHALTEAAPVYQWHADLRRAEIIQAWKTNGLLPHQVVIWVKARQVLTYAHFMTQHEPCLYGWPKGEQADHDRRPPANVSTVWQLDQQGASHNIHPTEKPVELFVGELADAQVPAHRPGEPFSGSGSAIIAAHQEGRRCNAVELAPQYVDVACRRFQEHTGIKPILEATGEPHDFTAG